MFELGKVLTPEHRGEVLPRFFQLGKREAKAVAAALLPDDAPRREVVTSVRPSAPPQSLAAPRDSAEGGATCAASVAPSPLPAADPEVAPVGSVSLGVVCPAKPVRASFTSAPQQGPASRPDPSPAAKPEHVPAHVKRAVWTRDGGRCQWPLASGGICGSTLRVEIDHRTVRARGGPPTVENLRCLCRVHNDLAAREVFGDAWMDRYTRGKRARSPAPGQHAPAL